MNDKNQLTAILLSAGLGTRLKSLTANRPKCLMKIGAKTIMDLWIEKLAKINCTKVIINTHYLSEMVTEHIKTINCNGMDIIIEHEKSLLGTGGTLIKNKDKLGKSTCIMIHCDNYMEDDLSGILEKHNQRPEGFNTTMLTFKTKEPESCGIVEIFPDGSMKSFEEKPKNPKSNLASGAIFVMEQEALQGITNLKIEGNLDFSKDCMPKIKGKIQTWHTNKVFIDIGTPERLMEANKHYNSTEKKS